MQKINFLPQVKLWNAAEFNARHVWANPALGEMTYDGSLFSNKFAVALQGKSGPEWKYLLTSDSSTDNPMLLLRLMTGPASYADISAGEGGTLIVNTGSLYSSENPLATMEDVTQVVAGASILGLKMDSSYIHTDSSFLHLKSDSSHPYSDAGDTAGAAVNPLATVATVQAATTGLNASIQDLSTFVHNLGDLLVLKGTYANPDPTSGATTFSGLLNYINSNGGFSGYKNGSVIIFGDEEYVLINPAQPQDAGSWELLGVIDQPDEYVTSFGGQTGAVSISGDSFYMNGKQLTLATASDTSMGGVKTGHSSYYTGSSYIYDLKVGGNDASDASRGYVEIPIVTGSQNDASYGLVPNAMLTGGAQMYTVKIDPSTCPNNVAYETIYNVNITHNLGTDDVMVDVFKYKAGSTVRPGRQLVYVDEIIAGPNAIRIDFGSSEAFLGCQERGTNDSYLGYIVTIVASTSAVALNASIDANVQENN